MNTNIHLTELGHAKATLCKPMSNFRKHHKQIRMREKAFSLKKIISLKYSGVRFCFEVFIETNTLCNRILISILGVETIVFFIFEIMCMHALLVLSLSLTCMQHSLSERPV